jgi:hypothetical protein
MVTFRWPLLLLPLAACSGAPEPNNKSDSNADGDDSVADSQEDSPVDSKEDSPTDSPAPAEDPEPCFTYAAPVQTGTVVDANLDEISDVVPSRQNGGVLWVHEDSGNDSILTAIDAGGATLGTIAIEGVTMVDWEDLAISTCDEGWCLWVGDIGDNMQNRGGVKVVRLVEPVIDRAAGVFAVTLTGTVYELPYPDGSHNAEGMGWSKDGPVIFTKRDGNISEVYTGDLAAGTLTLRGALSLDRNTATAADIWPDDSRVLLRTYVDLWEYWLPSGGFADLAHAIRVPVPIAEEVQGESASYDPVRRGYWTISERANQPIWFSGCSSER